MSDWHGGDRPAPRGERELGREGGRELGREGDRELGREGGRELGGEGDRASADALWVAEIGPLRRTFSPRTEQVRRAREFATEVLRRWGLSREEVLLAVSELATNAVTHADSDFTVSLRRTSQGVVVEVEDRSSHEPVRRAGSPVAIDGRGLAIVDRLARTWGVRRVPEDGKVVWAEL